MNSEKLKKILGNVLKEHGFIKKASNFYWVNEKLIIAIFLQKSMFSREIIYINYGLVIKELHPNLKQPKIYEYDYTSRFKFKKNNQIQPDINLTQYGEEEILTNLKENIKRDIIPLIKNAGDIKRFFKNNNAKLLTAKLIFKEYLEK